MRPHRAAAFVDAAPIGGRGHRTRQTELLISERDRLIIEAARFYPGCRDREIARRLRIALSTCRNGRCVEIASRRPARCSTVASWCSRCG
jgi:hypothetical protein